jgi:hypothetical protein
MGNPAQITTRTTLMNTSIEHAMPLMHSAVTHTDTSMRVHKNLRTENFCICHTSCHTELDSL